MKKTPRDHSKDNLQEKIIEKAIRTGGFAFPKTISEVKEFERIYGTTDVILPIELQDTGFLYSQSNQINKTKTETFECDNLAWAAREASCLLPEEIKKKMAEDRKKADIKRKRKK